MIDWLDYFDFVRLYWFDWFENRTHSKIGVRFCSIAQPNRTIGVRLGSIGFLFGFVRLDRSGLIVLFRSWNYCLKHSNKHTILIQLDGWHLLLQEWLLKRLFTSWIFFLSIFVIIFYLIVSGCIASHFTLYLIVEFCVVYSKYTHTRSHLLGPEVKRRQLYRVPLRKITHSFFADS